MMSYYNYEIARAKTQQAQDRAETQRLRRLARSRAAATYGVGVIEAVGHGLIAIGSRLVSDSTDTPPNHRRAA